MKLFPLREDILRISEKEIRIKIPYIDKYSEEFKNTAANCFYCRNYSIHSGGDAIVSLTMGITNEKSKLLISRYISTVVIHGAEYAQKICESIKSLHESDQRYILEVFLDEVKYNIADAHLKSGLRRALERRFASPFPEHPNLWAQMLKLSPPSRR